MSVIYYIEEQTIYLSGTEGVILTIREETEGTEVILTLTGTLRNEVVPYLRDELESLLSIGLHVTTDLSGLQYVSAAAQQVFLLAQKRIERTGKGNLKFVRLQKTVAEALVRTGVSEFLNIEWGENK